MESFNANASTISILWTYIGELIFNMLDLVGTVKMSNYVVKKYDGIINNLLFNVYK